MAEPGREQKAPVRRYAAFISYRHADNREEGRRWADWLHQALETYAVPADLVGTTNLRGDTIPPTLYPVFRDEEELPADADLTQNLRRALEASGALVVICSPRACESRHVDAEIRLFKEAGGSPRILAIMVDGEPNADDPGRVAAGFPPEMECLPEALRFGVPDASGKVDWSRRTEPIAADARPGGRPEQGYTSAGAYAEALRRAGGRSRGEIHRLQREFAGRLDLARLKVVAGVLGVPLGRLRKRDAVYRARRFRRLALVFGSLALLALVAAGVATWQGSLAARNLREAQTARRIQQAQLVEASRHAHASAEREFREGRWRQGVTLLGQALRYDRENRAAAAHLWSALAYGRGDRDEPPLATFDLGGAAVEALGIDREGRRLGVITADARLHVLDLSTGEHREAALPSTRYVQRIRFSPSGRSLVFCGDVLGVYLAAWDAEGGAPTVARLEGEYHDAVFSPGGDALLAVGALYGVERLDPATGRRPAPPGPPTTTTLAAVFGDDGRFLFRSEANGSCDLLNLETGVRRDLPGLRGDASFGHAVLSAGGRFLALPAGGDRAWVSDLGTGERVVTAEEGVGRWPGFAFAPDATACVVDRPDGSLEMRALPEGRSLPPFVHHVPRPFRAAFAPDGASLYTAGADGSVAAWARPAGASGGPRGLGQGPAQGSAWLPSARLVILRDEKLELWDVARGDLVRRTESGPSPGGIVAAPDGSWIASGGPGGRIRVWDGDLHTPPREMEGPPLDSYRLLASPTGTHLLVSGYDLGGGKLAQRLRLLEIASGRAVGEDVVTGRLSVRVGVSGDGRRLISALGPEGPWQGWDASSGRLLEGVGEEDRRLLLEGEQRAGVGELAVPLTASKTPLRAIVDLETRLPQSEPLGEAGGGLSWSPEGRYVVATAADGEVTIYETPRAGAPGPWLDDLVAAAGGLGLTASGLGQPILPRDRLAALARLRQATIEDPDWARLLAWWLHGARRVRLGP